MRSTRSSRTDRAAPGVLGQTTSLHVDTGRDWRGGQAQVLHLVRGLLNAGDRASLVTPPGAPLARRAAAHGVPCHEVALRGEWDVASVVGLYRLIRAERPQIVHTHTAHALTLAGLAARWARTPLVIAARRVDFPVSRLGRAKLERLADVVIAVSREVERVLVSCGVDPAKTVVVPSGVEPPEPDEAATDLRRELAVERTVALIGTVGALVDHKDHRTLIAAAARVIEAHPQTRFVIVGDGPLRPALEQQAAAAGLSSHVRFTGFRADARALVRELDMFVMSSHSEGLGTSVLDAMCAGVPVVATRAGGIPEMIEDGSTGLLVPVDDPAAMATAIGRLLVDVPLARRLATAASHRAATEFSAAAMVGRTRDVYRAGLRPASRHPR